MRAGHAGQAIDLDGLEGQLDARGRERRLRASSSARCAAKHRLKAAAPAAALARMGAVAGGGTDAQIEAVGRFFEALGLAFQIIDDVLNLRGFKNDLKSRGEDVTNGSITLPVAKAMARLDAPARAQAGGDAGSHRPIRVDVVGAWSRRWRAAARCRPAPTRRATWSRTAWRAADPLLPDTDSQGDAARVRLVHPRAPLLNSAARDARQR